MATIVYHPLISWLLAGITILAGALPATTMPGSQPCHCGIRQCSRRCDCCQAPIARPRHCCSTPASASTCRCAASSQRPSEPGIPDKADDRQRGSRLVCLTAELPAVELAVATRAGMQHPPAALASPAAPRQATLCRWLI